MSDGYYWRLKVRAGRKYDPGQPREPAGSPEGGRWTSGGGTSARNFEAGQYRGYRLSGENRLPPGVVEEDATVLLAPDGDLIVVPGRKVAHANIVGEMGDTANFDKYARGDVLKQYDPASGGTVPLLVVKSRQLGAGHEGGAALDRAAERRIAAMARAMIRAGYPRDMGVQWHVAGGQPLEGLTVGDFKSARTLGWWAEKS